MSHIIYKEESYAIIGALFEVHNNLGGGFSEIVYKDALSIELNLRNIPFEREKEYIVNYKGNILPHRFYADFVVFGKIILEIKSVTNMQDKFMAQCINYLKVSNCKLALLVNFHKEFLDHQKIVL
ncbi:MAG TPA: GxxExxY protein [Flavobacteriaceae bacterium]|nr:GxxExxY protein [Flavobacteriaceae bacterium]